MSKFFTVFVLGLLFSFYLFSVVTGLGNLRGPKDALAKKAAKSIFVRRQDTMSKLIALTVFVDNRY